MTFAELGSQLDDESLQTLLYEVMAIINGRPLTTDNLEDPDSLLPLSANQLLTMKSHHRQKLRTSSVVRMRQMGK